MQRHVVTFLALGLVALTFSPASAQSEGSGVLVGRVLDPDGNTIVGAQVAVTGTGLSATTDEQGGFRLSAVPTGTYTVTVTYLSTLGGTQEVTIERGQTVRVAFTLTPFTEEVEVYATPLLLGQARALNQQKNAVNISNIVSADQIGQFPDPNAAEATQRIPAITLQRDQGEGRYILVRGMEARLNSTTVDGERIPSPEAGTRDIALDVIPADLLQAIEVSKALTPDMDGDAIGGAVNLVTKRAPEQTRISGTAAGGYNEIVEDSIENANFTYGSRFGDEKKLGVLVSGSFYDTNRGSDNFEPEYDDGELDTLELRDYLVRRERNGLNSSLDYRASDQTTLYARYLWNRYRDTEIRRAKVNAVGDGEIAREIKDRLQASKITSLTAGGSHQIGTSGTLEFRAAYNQSYEHTPNGLDSVFLLEDVEFDPNVGPGSIDPDNIRANPLNEDPNGFFLDELEAYDEYAEEEDLVFATDYAHAFYRDSSFSGRYRFGVKLRFKDKNQENEVFELGPEDDVNMIDVLSAFRSQTPFIGGRYELGLFADPPAVRGLLGQVEFEEERNLEEDLADFQVTEDTLAAYAMTELELGAKTTFLGGVRVEDTTNEYSAFELEFDEEGDPVALRPVGGDRSYTEALPMVHLKYRLDERTNLRAAVTRSLARPNFEDLAPFQLIIREDDEIERGNPDLEVTTATNLDLMVEHYFETVGLVSAGLFYKDLKDNIFTFRAEEDFQGEEFDITQKRNGESASILGFELAYQNHFESGLGFYFNFTWSDSEASYPDRPEERLQGQADTVGNLALSYERGRFSGRVSANYHGDYILEIGEEAPEDLFVDEHVQIDLSASLQITERLSLALQAINLTDEPFRVFEGVPDRPIQEEYYSWWATLGLKFNF